MAKKTKLETKKLLEEDLKKYDLEGLASVSKQVQQSTVEITTRNELRFLVDSYYQTQKRRMGAQNQIRSIIQGYDNNASDDKQEVPLALTWVMENEKNQEKQILKLLDSFTNDTAVGRWGKAIIGVGPVTMAAMIAYFDISKCSHQNQFHQFAGLNDNNVQWLGREKATKAVNDAIEMAGYDKYVSGEIPSEVISYTAEITNRKPESLVIRAVEEDGKYEGLVTKNSLIKYLAKIPYNAELKRILWNLGQSFVKVSNKENSLYGALYKERKAIYNYRNDTGEYKERAEQILSEKNFGKGTDAYKFYSEGKLPPAHIQAMAERFAVKMFVSHLFDAMYLDYYKKQPPTPYPIEHQGHVDIIEPEVPYKDFIKF